MGSGPWQNLRGHLAKIPALEKKSTRHCGMLFPFARLLFAIGWPPVVPPTEGRRARNHSCACDTVVVALRSCPMNTYFRDSCRGRA